MGGSGVSFVRLIAGTGLIAASLALAACGAGADGLLKATGGVTTEANAVTTGAVVTADAGNAYPSTGSTPEEGRFNPFDHSSGPAAGGREVIANPSPAEVLQTGPLAEMSFGRADAPVTLVQYASLTCPHCKRFHAEVYPELKRAYIDTGKVRYVLREFPIGRTSGNATIALRCIAPAKYLDLYGRFMAEQASWVSQEVRLDAIFAVAAKSGLKQAEFDACLQNQAMIDGLKWVKERGRKLGVIGTPNFFVDGKLVKGTVGVKELHDLLDPALAAKAAGNAPAKSG
jgi:protein-disulfide isomerase